MHLDRAAPVCGLTYCNAAWCCMVVAFVWWLGGVHFQLLVGVQAVFLNTLTEAGISLRE